MSTRLLWLAASMKSFDVLVALLPTDKKNVEVCGLVADMLPLLQSVHKHQRAPPQVLVTLSDEASLAETELHPHPQLILLGVLQAGGRGGDDLRRRRVVPHTVGRPIILRL